MFGSNKIKQKLVVYKIKRIENNLYFRMNSFETYLRINKRYTYLYNNNEYNFELFQNCQNLKNVNAIQTKVPGILEVSTYYELRHTVDC